MADGISLVELVIDVNDGLAAAGVGHGFGGALALAYYVADPRATRGMDINVSVPVEEAASVLVLLPPSVAWTQSDVERCRRDGQVALWHGIPGKGIRVALFFPQHRFHQAVAAATSMRPFARPDYLLPVIAAAHLVVFKALFNRRKDWIDMAAMLSAGTVEVAESLRWLGELLGASDPAYRRLEEMARQPEAGPAAHSPTRTLPVVDWSRLGGH